MSQYNPEASYVRTYLDWLIEVPWSMASPNNVRIDNAEAVLNKDHYGLAKIKERIIEYLAVMKLRRHMEEEAHKAEKKDGKEKYEPKSAPTILCFVGPPGVGKTSLGRSIARAMGRKFARISHIKRLQEAGRLDASLRWHSAWRMAHGDKARH